MLSEAASERWLSRTAKLRNPIGPLTVLAQRHSALDDGSGSGEPGDPPSSTPDRADVDDPEALPRVRLVLYVSPESSASQRARRYVETLVAKLDAARVTLEVCDVCADPQRGEADRVVFTPTLVARSGEMATWVLGDLTNPSTLLDVLHNCGLEPEP